MPASKQPELDPKFFRDLRQTEDIEVSCHLPGPLQLYGRAHSSGIAARWEGPHRLPCMKLRCQKFVTAPRATLQSCVRAPGLLSMSCMSGSPGNMRLTRSLLVGVVAATPAST